MQLSEELYEHIRNTCACIDDALSSETLADINDYLSMAERSAQSAFDMIEKQREKNTAGKVEPKFKVKYAGSEYNVFETKDIAGVTFYGIEDEPNHIDYVKAENCDIISGYAIKENGSPYPTKPAVFSEQKPADKVKPKFHEGDWVIGRATENEPRQIAEIKKEGYKTTYGGWIGFSFEEDMRLWTIEDAKDGDVLACNNGWTCIFKTLVNDETFSSYCFMDKTKWFCETGSECHTLKEEFVKAYNGKIYPATKEQRELLFQKMKEAGYEWDAKRKELKKIDTYCQNNCKGFQEIGKCFFVMENVRLKKKEHNLQDNNFSQIEQKPIEWNEEDKKHFDNIIQELKNQYDRPINASYKEIIISDIDWFKSLKDRVKPEQEWSEKDIEYYNTILTILEQTKDINGLSDNQINFLKSFRPQKQWKPSKEQIMALKWALNRVPYDSYTEELYGLLEQLKQL